MRRKKNLDPIPTALRQRVAARDGKCRGGCGSSQFELHHIEYRSQGGPHADWNLIALCQQCHQKVHSNKRLYQPLLRGIIWLQLAEGRYVTLPQMEKIDAQARGLE